MDESTSLIDLDCEGKKGNKFSVKKKNSDSFFRERESEKKNLIRIFSNARMIPKIFSDRSQRKREKKRARDNGEERWLKFSL